MNHNAVAGVGSASYGNTTRAYGGQNMPQQVPRCYLVTTCFQQKSGREVVAMYRLFSTTDDVAEYANSLTIPDLVCAALDEDLDLHGVDAVYLNVAEFVDGVVVNALNGREWDYTGLVAGGFMNPPAEVLDGMVPSLA